MKQSEGPGQKGRAKTAGTGTVKKQYAAGAERKNGSAGDKLAAPPQGGKDKKSPGALNGERQGRGDVCPPSGCQMQVTFRPDRNLVFRGIPVADR